MNIVFCKGRLEGVSSGADEALVTYATQLKAHGHKVWVQTLFPSAPRDSYLIRLQKAGVIVSSIIPYHPVLEDFYIFGRRKFPPEQQNKLWLQRAYRQVCAFFLAASCRARFAHYKRRGAQCVHVIKADGAAHTLIVAARSVGLSVLYQELDEPFTAGREAVDASFAPSLWHCSAVMATSPRLARACERRYRSYGVSRSVSVCPLVVEDLPTGALELPAPYKTVRFGFAARIERVKGPLVLLEAFARLCQQEERAASVSLKIAGFGLREEEVLGHAARLGILKSFFMEDYFAGAQQRHDFMRNLDVYVMPTLRDGTPISVIEAMSHGLPVIASDVGGISDLLSDDSGILVPPGDVERLHDAMARLVSDSALRRRLGEAARRRYETLFAPEVALPVLLETYSRLTNFTQRSEKTNGAKILNRASSELHHPWRKTN